MFSKKPHQDLKKSSLKVLDVKRDAAHRLKHLKIILESIDPPEIQAFFEANYSHVYYIFHDVFLNVEYNLRQRVQKVYKEELDVVKLVFEKILIFLPELLHQRWQSHSIKIILKKFLHHANPTKLRKDGIRLFILWYQILGENTSPDIDAMFCTLVPGLHPKYPNPFLLAQGSFRSALSSSNYMSDQPTPDSVFYGSNSSSAAEEIFPVTSPETTPLIQGQPSEVQMEDHTCFYLDVLLETIVSQVPRIEWREKKEEMHRLSFNFLFSKFKTFYLPHIFPKFSWTSSIYTPKLVLPELRYEKDLHQEQEKTDLTQLPRKQTPIECQVLVVRWVAAFTQSFKRTEPTMSTSVNVTCPVSSTIVPSVAAPITSLTSNNAGAVNPSSVGPPSEKIQSQDENSSLLSERRPTLDANSRQGTAPPSTEPVSTPLPDHRPDVYTQNIVLETFYSSRENINFVHEIFKQAFCFPFSHANVMRRVILVYKEWIHKSVAELPIFLQEPNEQDQSEAELPPPEIQTTGGIPYVPFENSEDDGKALSSEQQHKAPLTYGRLRKDSYLKAIFRPTKYLKAGMQKLLQTFILNASNVFLLELMPGKEVLLEEQVDVTKRVLNLYRYMVMNVQMETKTWEQLLLTLLQIASQVLKPIPPPRKQDMLGGRLAPALFQTLIVTWIRANLNVVICLPLWDQFQHVLSSLTQWEELIKEWSKTMETLTRVLAKQVYHLDMNDLPLDRLSEQKQKKKRGMKNPPNVADSSALSDSANRSPALLSSNGSEPPLSMSLSSKSSTREEPTSKSTLRFEPTTVDGTSAPQEAPPVSNQNIRSRSGSGQAIPAATSSSRKSIHPFVGENALMKSISDSKLYTKKFATSEIDSTNTQRQAATSLGKNIATDEVVQMLAVAEQYIRDQEAAMNISPFSRSKSLDFLLQRAESPILSETSDGPSRTPSPTPSTGMESTSIKDSPMQIDVVVSSADNSCNTSEVGAPSCASQSVMAGGTRRGWTADVSVVLWRRMLGALGNINAIPDPAIHAQVLEHLKDTSETLIKIRDNLGVTSDNQSSPPPPELVPHITLITPWLFEAIKLPAQFSAGKLKAYYLLILLTLRKHDIPLSMEYLCHFYYTLHHGLVGNDQEVITTLVSACGPKYFTQCLPGYTLLTLDFIHAANTVAMSKSKECEPRTKALHLLCSLMGSLTVYTDLKALKPTSAELLLIRCDNAKDHIISILMRSAKSEPVGLVRCHALNCLGIFVYQEMVHRSNHSRVREAILVLLSALRFTVKSVAQVASDILLFLCDHAEYMKEYYQDIPCQIIETFVYTLSNLLPQPDATISDEDKKLLITLIFCLGEWCIHLPLSFLAPSKTSQLLLHSIFEVLHFAATGQKGLPSNHKLEMCMFDLEPTVVEYADHTFAGSGTKSTSTASGLGSTKSFGSGGVNERTSPESFFYRTSLIPSDPKSNVGIVQLAARTLISHLLIHLGHFPMGIGASSLTSQLSEHDDVPHLKGLDLHADVFTSPNVQFFVLNQCAIISFVEIPSPTSPSLPGGGSDLLTGSTQVRIIVRDLNGKFCWDSSLLYGKAPTSAPSLTPLPRSLSQKESNILVKNSPSELPVISSSAYPLTSSLSVVASSISTTSSAYAHRPPTSLPTVENAAPGHDNLDALLHYIGNSSPECILRPGLQLNSPAPAANGEIERETEFINSVLGQWSQEGIYAAKHADDSSMVCKPVEPPAAAKDCSPFQFCRLLIDQLGYTAWEQRPHLDLLKKNEKLLRELKNLDKQKSREAHKIAVIYVAKGQEDKNSVLLNTGGSQDYEEFVSGLGWEIELENHYGFLGGLPNQRQSGETTVYYATSLLEVIFHVSTRMPVTSDEDALTKKLRHLGNDEIHVVWSEHVRDYRRGIIATEFCDVLIVIYPLGNRLYRVHIDSKSEVPFFGPLYNNAIVDRKVLPGLVRATAINASRAIRNSSPLYQHFFEERVRALDQLIQNHRDSTTFEEFAANIISPAPPTSVNAMDSLPSEHHPNSSVPLRPRPVSMSSTEKSPRFSPTIRASTQRERPFSATAPPQAP